MAVLTWRNVDAPDFRPAMQGFQQFSNLLGNAFEGLDRGLQRFDDQQSNAVNQQLMLDIAAAQDSDEAKALLASLGSRPGANRINAQTAALAMGRPTALTEQAAAEGNLDWTNLTRGWAKDDRAALEAARPAMAELASARASGDPARIAAAEAEFGKVRSTLPFDKMMASFADLQNLEKGAVGIQGQRQDQTIQLAQEGRNQERFGWDRTNQQHAWSDRDAMLQAEHIAAQALQLGGGKAEGTRAEFDRLSRNASPRAAYLAMNMINQGLGSGIFAPDELMATGAAGAGSGDASALRVMNYEARAAGFASVPDTVRTLGQASEFAKQLNNRGVKSSAMGVYQIVGDTMRRYAPKVLGSGWQNAEFNFENQDKLARAIFEDHKHSASALRKQWVSLTPAEAERIRKLPWEQAREVIARKESSSSPAALQGAATMALAETAGRIMQDDRHGIVGDFMELAQSGQNPPIADVVAKLREGPFAGTDRGFLVNQVRRIMREGNVNAAMAGAILARNVDQEIGSRVLNFFNRLGGGTPDLGGGIRLDDRGVAEDINLAKTGELYKQVANNQAVRDAQAAVATATANYNQKRAAFQAAQRRAATGGMSEANLARYAADLAAAEEALRSATIAVGASSTLRAQREAPNEPGFLEGLLRFRRN